jgi:hypothetical protein
MQITQWGFLVASADTAIIGFDHKLNACKAASVCDAMMLWRNWVLFFVSQSTKSTREGVSTKRKISRLIGVQEAELLVTPIDRCGSGGVTSK